MDEGSRAKLLPVASFMSCISYKTSPLSRAFATWAALESGWWYPFWCDVRRSLPADAGRADGCPPELVVGRFIEVLRPPDRRFPVPIMALFTRLDGLMVS
jgi:hypothetical protein